MRLVFQTQRLPRVIVIIILISHSVLNKAQLQPSLPQPQPPISHCSISTSQIFSQPQKFNNQLIKCRIGLIRIVLLSSNILNILEIFCSQIWYCYEGKVKQIQSDSTDHLGREITKNIWTEACLVTLVSWLSAVWTDDPVWTAKMPSVLVSLSQSDRSRWWYVKLTGLHPVNSN